MLPETIFHTLRKSWKRQWTLAFCTALFAGLLIHLYRLTNNLLNWDSVYNFHSDQNAIHLGRCFLTLTCGISSYYDLHWINGLLSLVYMGLTCICLVEIFGIRKKLSIFLVSALTVSFPSVASTFAYMYTADGYFLAMLLMTLAVLITLRQKRGFIPALFLIAFAYGSYQAYITYAVMLILCWSIIQILCHDRPFRELAGYWGRFLIMGIAGTALYLCANKLLTLIEKVSVSDYNGIASMGIPGASALLSAVKNCVIDFAYFFFGPLDGVSFYKFLNALTLLLLAAMVLYPFIRKKLYRKPAETCALVLCLAAMPFACSLIYFTSPEVRYYMLMYAGFSLIYILPVLLYDKIQGAAGLRFLLSWGCVLTTALTIFNFALISNISYLYMQTSYEKTYGLVLRMADRIEQLDDFDSVEKLCVIGHFQGYDDISLSIPPAMAGVKDGYFISEQEHFAAMMKDRFGLELANSSEEETERIRKSADFRKMPCWPETGSVKKFGDTAVIKIAEE